MCSGGERLNAKAESKRPGNGLMVSARPQWCSPKQGQAVKVSWIHYTL